MLGKVTNTKTNGENKPKNNPKFKINILINLFTFYPISSLRIALPRMVHVIIIVTLSNKNI